MNRLIIALTFIVSMVWTAQAQEQTWREMPNYLKGYEKEYARSPKEAALAWFQDARFGLFIHWGPATLYKKGEWVMYNQKIPLDEYEATARRFTGENFNAQDYVDLALSAGMKYITFVAKHHDGYALWDSPASDYNSMDGTPKRDFVRELAEACRKAGLGFFIYYSVGLDWHHPYYLPRSMYNAARPDYKVQPTQYKYKNTEDFKQYMNFAKTQIMELCTQYGPIAGLWFDTVGGVYQYPELFNIQEVYDMIHTIQPHALVVFKTGANGNEDFITGEGNMGSLAPLFKNAGLPQKVQDAADRSWENNKGKPAELNIPIQKLAWGYYESPKQHQKTPAEVWELLEKCAQWKANLLLNIAPYPDGRIQEANIETLKAVGERIRKEGFPKLNTKDYMDYRTKSKQTVRKEKINQNGELNDNLAIK